MSKKRAAEAGQITLEKVKPQLLKVIKIIRAGMDKKQSAERHRVELLAGFNELLDVLLYLNGVPRAPKKRPKAAFGRPRTCRTP